VQRDPAALRHADDQHRIEREEGADCDQVVGLAVEARRCGRASEAAAVDGDDREAVPQRFDLRAPDPAVQRPAVEQEDRRALAGDFDLDRAAGDRDLEDA